MNLINSNQLNAFKYTLEVKFIQDLQVYLLKNSKSYLNVSSLLVLAKCQTCLKMLQKYLNNQP